MLSYAQQAIARKSGFHEEEPMGEDNKGLITFQSIGPVLARAMVASVNVH